MSAKHYVPYDDMGHWDHTSGDNYLTKHHEWTDRYLEQVSELVGEDLVAAQHYARKLSTRFYFTSNLNGSTIIREITGYGRAETVTPIRLKSYQRQIYGRTIEDELGKVGVDDILPVVNSSLYYPKAIALVAINEGVYFNTYQPPIYDPQRKVVNASTTYGQRPLVWRQFLKRWFPNDFSGALVLEGYIARLLHDPLNRPRWAMVFRSDQGTGKGFLTETLLPKLIGNKNINITSLDKIVGKFNGNQFSNKLIVLNETDNDRKGTYTKLKDKISDSVITVEEKYQNPVSQPLFNGTFVFSNEDHPLYADEDDRRFYVTPRLKHQVDREETQKFIAAFADWLDTNHSGDDGSLSGWEIMAAWFAYVAEQKNFNEVNTYVVSKEGNCISDLTVKPQTADQEADLVAALDEGENKKYLWRVADIREAYPYIKQALVEQLLVNAGYSHREKNNIKGDSTRRAGWAWSTYGSAQIKCEGIGHPDNLKPRVKV